MSSHLLIIDGTNVARGIFEANPSPDIAGKVAGALRATVGSLRRAFKEHPCTHAVVVFDAQGQTWRHALLPDYKRGRTPMPDELRRGIEALPMMIRETFGVESLTISGVEADDVIGKLVERWLESTPVGTVEILSTDTDMCCLLALSSRVEVYNHFKRLPRTAESIHVKYGVYPNQLRDFLALKGDVVGKGIPGVRGIGATYATELLNTYGSLEGILAADSEDKAVKKVQASAADARLSYELVGLSCERPLGVTWNQLRVRGAPAEVESSAMSMG